jgi:signal transduction histidine kinase
MTPAKRAYQRRPREAPTDDGAALAARVKALEDENIALQAENSALKGFAAVAAHELLTPLVIAESYAAIVGDRLDGDEHAESRKDLLALGRTAARSRVLVEMLLQEAHASRQPLVRRRVNLDAVVGELVAVLEPEIAERGIRVELSELPEVLGDEVLLSALFMNLLVNALKYSPRRDGTIAVAAERELGQWRFVIESSGPTIPPDDHGRIFEPYNRGRGERREKGAGLGLAICRRVVERHGGTIGVSATDGGNRFHFTLPAVRRRS